jgi:hypothetical protein
MIAVDAATSTHFPMRIRAPMPPHLNPLPKGEEDHRHIQFVRVADAPIDSLSRGQNQCARIRHALSGTAPIDDSLSLWERIKVRVCHGESRKLGTFGKPPLQPSAAFGVAFGISSCTATSSAASIRLETESSTSSATTRSLRLSWMARGMVTRAARRQTWSARANCWRAAFASSASGITKCWGISRGLSKRSFYNWTSRSRAGAALILPHLNPLPEGEEDAQRQVRANQRTSTEARMSLQPPHLNPLPEGEQDAQRQMRARSTHPRLFMKSKGEI